HRTGKKTANRNHVCRSCALAMPSFTDRRCTSGSKLSSGGDRKTDAHSTPHYPSVGPSEREATLLSCLCKKTKPAGGRGQKTGTLGILAQLEVRTSRIMQPTSTSLPVKPCDRKPSV